MRPFPLVALLALAFAACGAACTASGDPPDAGEPAASLRDAFTSGALEVELVPRVSAAGLQVQRWGSRLLTLTLRRDEQGRVLRRLTVNVGANLLWAVEEAPGERFHDFAVHPSGEVTLGVERLGVPSDAYDLVRFAADGRLLHRQVLARPQSIPATDRPSPFEMTGVPSGSVVRGWLPWLQLEPNGEDVVLGLLSKVDGRSGTAVSALLSLRWDGRFTERWARIVDGDHGLIAVAWQYDDFLWLDAATRLLVRVTDGGDVVVGRTLGSGRCLALADTFGELTQTDCRQLRSFNSEHRYQPFALTVFSADGARLRTRVLAPPRLDEFVIFDMAVRDGDVAVAGTAVRWGPNDAPEPYFEPPGRTSSTAYMPYDGYLAVVRADETVTSERFIDLGRGELLSSVEWTDEGLVAGGAADWNRWTGGMSLSRGAQPWLVLAPLDDGQEVVRVAPTEQRDRHAHVFDLDVHDGEVLAVGPGDAPMTHSGDVSIAPMAMGSVRLGLRAP